VYLLIFLLEKRPFANKTLENYKFVHSESEEDQTHLHHQHQELDSLQNKSKTASISPAYVSRNAKSPSIAPSYKLLASPSLLIKLMPTESISKSPIFQRKRLSVEASQNSLGAEGLAKNSLSKYLLNPSEKSNIIKKGASAIPSEEGSKLTSIPVSRSMKKSYAELKENKSMFLQHLGVEIKGIINTDESDISSTISNSENGAEIMDGPRDIMMNLEVNSNAKSTTVEDKSKKNNNLNRFKSIEEKEIKIGSTAVDKLKTFGNKLLNLENLKKDNSNPSSVSNGSNPNSARESKVHENALYPSKKYEGDVNYINQKIYQASMINQKLALG